MGLDTSCPGTSRQRRHWRSSTNSYTNSTPRPKATVSSGATPTNGYLASCGLTVPRLDNIHHTVDFARDMQRIVNRFNAETGHKIRLRAGIDTGTVTSGLIGRAGLVYDLWGGAVHLASTMRRRAAQPVSTCSQEVYEATRDTRQYTPSGAMTVGDREEPTWRLSEDQR